MAGSAHGDGDSFPLDRPDVGGLELAERIGPNHYSVPGVDDAGFDDARDDGTDERNGESVVDVKLKGRLGVVVAVVREDVELS